MELYRNRGSFPQETDKIYSARKILPNNFPRKQKGGKWNILILFVFKGRTLSQRKLVLKGFYFSVANLYNFLYTRKELLFDKDYNDFGRKVRIRMPTLTEEA